MFISAHVLISSVVSRQSDYLLFSPPEPTESLTSGLLDGARLSINLKITLGFTLLHHEMSKVKAVEDFLKVLYFLTQSFLLNSRIINSNFLSLS